MIDRLRGAIDPERLFQFVPMIGPNLAHLIHEELEIETLEDLEAAAHDGSFVGLKGLGPRRVNGIRMALAEILARRRPRHGPVTLHRQQSPKYSMSIRNTGWRPMRAPCRRSRQGVSTRKAALGFPFCIPNADRGNLPRLIPIHPAPAGWVAQRIGLWSFLTRTDKMRDNARL